MRDDHFEIVACLSQRRHRRNDDIAEMPRVLLRRSVAVVIQCLLKLLGPPLELVRQPGDRVESLLALDRLRAGRSDAETLSATRF